jgi:uncharacterized protein YcnI
MTVITPARRRARLAGGLTLAAALVVGAPLAASAHVHVTPEAANAAASTRLSFSFSHDCDGSPTTALVVNIPDGVDGVTPVVDGAWTISRELGDDGIATQVIYTAVTPVEDGFTAAVAMDVIFATSAANTDVAFPVVQQCETGQNDWIEIAEDGQSVDDLEAPAPVVAVGAVAEGDGHGHGSDAADDEHADSEDHADSADSAEQGATEADPVARWLSAGALVAALAALGVTLLRRRRA